MNNPLPCILHLSKEPGARHGWFVHRLGQWMSVGSTSGWPVAGIRLWIICVSEQRGVKDPREPSQAATWEALGKWCKSIVGVGVAQSSGLGELKGIEP